MRAWATRLITIAALLAGTASVSGYVTAGHIWASNVVLYYINPSSTQLSAGALTSAIQQAAAIWSQQTLANIQLTYAGTTSGNSLTLNRKNEVFFRNEASSFSGETYWWYDQTNNLVDADIVFYEGGARFFVGSGCNSNGIYLEDLAVHEFGHVLGLEHSPVQGATMYPVMLSYCDTTQLTLASDDIAGLESLYPSGSTSQPPTAPSGLSASTGGTSSLSLSWADRSSNESGFHIERSTDGQSFARVSTQGAGTTSYSDGLLQSGTTYYYRVASFNGAGTSSYSNTASGQTSAPAATVPTAPGNLNVSGPTTSSLALSWVDFSNNETGFYVDVSTNGGAWYSRLGQVAGGVTGYTATGLTPATTYWFRITAFNGVGSSGASNVASGQTSSQASAPVPTTPSAPAPTTPIAPGSLTVSSATASSLALSWVDLSNNETGFYVDVSTNGGVWYSRLGQVAGGVTGYTATGLAPATTHWFRITAFNGVGSSGASNVASGQTSSQASAPVPATPSAPVPTTPVAPGSLTVSGATVSSLALSWVDFSNNETGFYVDVSTNGGAWYSRLGQVAAGVTGYTAAGLAPATTYWFRITAFNGVGSSGASNVASGQTSSQA
ncbi:MAG: fibronectin type III domain-containing protein, partial [Vicinamibacterales bacterium]